MGKVRNVQSYLNQHENHVDILNKLRNILLNYPFEEAIKWGMPTYVIDKKNLLSIGAFKNHVALWFFQGALLKDTEKLLHNAQEGKTMDMRQIHFNNIDSIDESKLKRYIEETIENHKKGLVVKVERKSTEIILPLELSATLDKDKDLYQHFFKLSPGKQREYSEYITLAKRDKTKIDRLRKILPLIAQEKGLYDKYKNC